MKRYKNPAIVIGGGVNGLGIIRNLGRNGIDVYSILEKKDESVYSKYCKKSFIIPKVEHDLEILKTFLTEFEQNLPDKAVLFPTSDVSVCIASRLINEMENYTAVISSKEILETLTQKKLLYNTLSKRGISHPTTLFLQDGNKLRDIEEKINYPILLKPSISQAFFKKFGKKGFIAKNKHELSHYISIMDKDNIDFIIQEIVPGPETNHYFIDGYFNKSSRPFALFARQRLRMWPSSLGNSSISGSIPLSDVNDMKGIIVDFLSSIGYKGIFNAEFKRDSENGKAKLIEINARSWWYNYFPTSCGLNIILFAYLDAINKPIKPSFNYEVNKNFIYLLEDLKWAFSHLAKGKGSFQEWRSPIKNNKDWAIFSRDDIRPFIMSYLSMFTSTILNPSTIAKYIKRNQTLN